MSQLLDAIRGQVADLKAKYAEAAVDGISISDAIALVVDFGDAVHASAHVVPGLTPEERRGAVLEAVDQFYAESIAPLDLPGVPNIVEGSIFDPTVGTLIHRVALGVLLGLERIRTRSGVVPAEPPAPETTA